MGSWLSILTLRNIVNVSAEIAGASGVLVAICGFLQCPFLRVDMVAGCGPPRRNLGCHIGLFLYRFRVPTVGVLFLYCIATGSDTRALGWECC